MYNLNSKNQIKIMKNHFLIKLLSGIVFIAMFSSCSGATTNSEDSEKIKDKDSRTKVLIETNFGNITLVLYNETPIHRDNFIKLVNDGFYDGTIFHRVINQFMIQGGDPDSKNAQPGQRLGVGGPGYTIEAEFREQFFHKKGALAAARQGDQVNPEKRSSGSQFYIVQGRVFSHEELDLFELRSGNDFSNEQRNVYSSIGGTPNLDGEYTVFGEVIEGIEVVDKIASVQTDNFNRPTEDISIKMTIVK